MAGKKKADPRKLPRQERAKMTVDAILTATARVLVDKGYDKMTTSRVADVAGVSVGSLYQYFPNKEALVLGVFRRHLDGLLEMLTESVGALIDVPLEEAVRRYVDVMMRTHEYDPELHRVLLQQAMHLGFDHVREAQTRVRQMVAAYLSRHRQRLIPDDLEVASFVAVATVESLTHLILFHDSVQLDRERQAQEIVAVVVRYLVGAPPADGPAAKT